MGIKSDQRGFGIIEIIVIVIVLAVTGLVAWRLLGSSVSAPSSGTTSSGSFVEWSFDGENWQATGAPQCETPLAVASPMDVSLATSILLPGQMRGNDFKPHGGIGIDGATNNQIDVSAIRDAYLYRGSRYIESGSVQYTFDFMDSCGIMYRFDHLLTLSAEFMAYAETLPEPKPDDSRTQIFNTHPLIKKGTLVATEVGIEQPLNAFFDVGVYDLRGRNQASSTDAYKTDQLRIGDKEQSFFAVCWFDLLPSADGQIVKALPLRGGDKEATSDYCD